MALNRKAAEEFVRYWAGRGDEKGETQQFWIDLLQNVLGDDDALRHLRFEARVDTEAGSSKGFADVTVMRADGRGALAMVEQKSASVDLDRPEQRQGRMVTPVQQCRAYAEALPFNEQPRWVLTCNFKVIRAYDRNMDPLCSKAPAFELALADLPRNLDALSFLTGGDSAPVLSHEVSVQAGALMGRVHDMLADSFATVMDPDDPAVHHALSVICTRLMFLMFCEDAGLIPASAFRDFLRETKAERLRKALADLFVWLDTPDSERDPFEARDGAFRAFPYMNGGLFAEKVQVPTIDETLRTELIIHGCQEFDWSGVSPTVFGSIFEGALSHDRRRAGGMHYTSPENIHRLIDPLFLDGLKAELAEALDKPVAGGGRTKALQRLHDKVGGLSFLDPACGSGNFLTETYVELRKLENRILLELNREESLRFAFEGVGESPVKVTLANFHGIEINDFACCVARTALWIAEKQADMDTAKVVRRVYDELPLTDYGCIVQGNALRMDWNDVVPAETCDYVVGNPPFIGYSNLTEGQKEDRASIFGKDGGTLDYVACWYKKASDYIRDLPTRCALVSTNSICQGQQVEPLWKPLFEGGVHIDFAHRTFVWNSEATDEAHVHVVIVGFSRTDVKPKLLFDEGGRQEVDHINAYLAPAPDAFIAKRKSPLCNALPMVRGCQPTDDGALLLTQDERDELLRREPAAEPYVKPFSMGAEYINGIPRYCLWMDGADPAVLLKLPLVRERVEHVREIRLQSKKAATQKKAATPWLFDEVRPPKGDSYIAVPSVSSGRRKYVPMGFVSNGMIPGNKLFFISDGGLYEFGILESQFQNAWMRLVAGRLKSDYNYSNTIVYNNFVWPDATPEQRKGIESCAQAVLDARAAHPDATLADMYDPDNDFLFGDLMAAHIALDAAVEAAYGVDFKGDEEKIVAHLFKLYAEKTGQAE